MPILRCSLPGLAECFTLGLTDAQLDYKRTTEKERDQVCCVKAEEIRDEQNR